MANLPQQRQPVVLNPGGGSVQIDDVDDFLAGYPRHDEPMVDLGGGMVVPLRELVADATDDDEDAEQ